jgi:hypothetical protein
MSMIEMPDEVIFDITSLGEGLRLRNRKTVELTEEFASRFLELPEFSNGDEKIDRNLSEDWVVHLAREMEIGTFRWEQVCLAKCTYEGRDYRMNGQHTAWGRLHVKLDKDVRTPVTLLHYEADSFQDMRQLYASFDRGKMRNRGNVVTSYLAGSEEFPGYNKRVLKMLASGLAMFKWGWDGHKRRLHTADEVAYLLLKDHHKVGLCVGAFINSSPVKEFKHLNRSPVLAAMFATFTKAPQIAASFWEVVRDGVGIDSKDDPRMTLRNYLLTTGLSVRQLPGESGTDQETMYRCCILAWNAHRAGRALKQFRVSGLEERPNAA